MKESIFQTEFKKNLEMQGFLIYKFYDIPGNRFTLQKPFDFIAIKNGKYFAFELKQIKSWKKITKKDFIRGKELKNDEIKNNWLLCNQAQNLDAVELNGGSSFIVINIRINSPRVNEVVFIEWQQAKRILNNNELTKDYLLNLIACGLSSSMKKGMFDIKI